MTRLRIRRRGPIWTVTCPCRSRIGDATTWHIAMRHAALHLALHRWWEGRLADETEAYLRKVAT